MFPNRVKGIFLLIIFLFSNIVFPVSMVLAEEIEADAEESVEQMEEDPIEESSEEMEIESEDSMEMMSLSEEEEVEGNDDPVFKSNQHAQVKGSNGELSYQVPIRIPPGRNGIQPNLSLQYTSNPDEKFSLFGYGWSISIPYIKRINKKGIQNLYSSDYFYSSLSGELASTSATTYISKNEDGSFINYALNGNVWTVTDKSGLVYTFGTASSSRQDNISDSSQIYKWMLQKIEDPNGNSATFEYYKDSGEIYPSHIVYTNTSTSSGIFEVNFLREARTDIATSSASGFPVITKFRINEINAEVNNDVVISHMLDYSNPNERFRSLLASVTEAGKDENGATTTLPAQQFDYQGSGENPGWTVTSFGPPVPFVSGSYGTNLGVTLAEVNGDGLPDVIRSYYKSISGPDLNIREVYINTGEGWVYDSNWVIPTVNNSVKNNEDKGVRFVDLNGDGLDDILESTNDDEVYAAYINNGNAWVSDSAWLPPNAFTTSTGRDRKMRIIDINGDGLVDILQNYHVNFTDYISAWLNTGSGWEQNSNFAPPVQFSAIMQLVEVDGDGLPDILRSHHTNDSSYEHFRQVYLHQGNVASGTPTGTRWNVAPDLMVPGQYEFMSNSVLKGFEFADINGDGATDVMENKEGEPANSIYISTNTGWTGSEEWADELPFHLINGNGRDNGLRIADVDADGLPDFLNNNNVWINRSNKVDLLSQITYPTGATTTIEYKSSHDYKDGDDLLNNLPFPVQTVSKITHSDGMGNESEYNYVYEDGFFYFNNAYDRKFPGFGIVSETDPEGNVTKTYYHQASTTNSALGEYDDHISKAGKPYRIEQYDNEDNLYSATVNKWDKESLGHDSYFVKLVDTLALTYDGDSDHKDKAESYAYDSVGNITLKKEWGEVVGNANGTFSDTGTDKLSTSYSYASSSTSTIKALISQEITLDSASSTIRESKYYYDSSSFGAISKGNLTKKEQLKSGSSYIDNEWTYNSLGLVTQEKDSRDKIISHVYDTANLYVASSTNPLSQTILYVYDYTSGKPKKVWDQNGIASEVMYDGIDRVITEKISDITSPSNFVTKSTYSYNLASLPNSIHRTDYLDPSATIDTYSYADGLGRILQERRSAEAGNGYSIIKKQYNSRGLLSQESLPVFSAGSAYTTATIPSNLYTDYSYDPLGRIVDAENVLGSTLNTYDDWDLITTDMLGNDKEYRNDAFGNLTRVKEINATSTYTTAYEWNGNKNLTKIIDAEGNVRNFTYDKLGRRLTAQDLHDVADGTFGTWTYVYDDASNLIQVVDAKNQTINRTFDDANRILTEDYTGNSGIETTFVYDSCTFGLGRLCAVSNTAASTTYQYTSLGQVDVETKKIASTTYATTYDYNRQGNVTGIIYPDDSEVAYTFNAAGMIESVAQKENGGSFANIVNNIDYAPTGKIVLKEFANGVNTEYTYDSNEMYRLRNIYTTRNDEEIGFMSEENDENLAVLSEKIPLLKVDTNDLKNLFSAKYALANRSMALEEPAPINTEETVSEEIIEEEIIEMPEEQKEEVQEEAQIEQKSDQDTIEEEIATTTVPAIEFEISTTTEESIKQQPDIKEISSSTKEVGSTTKFARLSALPDDSVELRLKSTPKNILGENYAGEGIVKYAYKTDIMVDDVPVSKATLQKAADSGITIKNEDVSKRTKYSRTFATDQENVFIAEIVADLPQYYEDENGMWWIADYGITTESSYKKQKEEKVKDDQSLIEKMLDAVSEVVSFMGRSLGLHMSTAYATTGTFYPDANSETNTVDGYIGAMGYSTWSEARNSSTGTSNDSSDVMSVMDEYTSSSRYNIRRGFLLFNTASIPDNAVLATTSLDIYVLGVAAASAEQRYYLVSSNPANNSSLTSEDFDLIGNNVYAVTDGTLSSNAHEILAFNATGTAQINKTGISKFALRTHNDLNNISSSNSDELSIDMSAAEASGTTQDPKLVVIYSIAPAAPTSLLTEGLTNPSAVTDTVPEFSAIYNDTDSTDIATHYRLQISTSSTFASMKWDSAMTILSSTTISSTRSPDISYGGSTLATSTTYYWRIKFWDQIGTEGQWSTATSTFSVLGLYTPEAPVSLQTEGVVNPSYISDTTPDFTAVFNDYDSGTGTHYQIQIATTSGFTSLFWDSAKTALSSAVATGTRTVEMPYTGTTSLALDTTYYWKVRLWDSTDLVSEWSTTTATFKLNEFGGNVVQDITFTYDAVGNIIKITDSSATQLAKETDYTYDSLYRLTSASTTGALAAPYHETYGYSAIGNMLTKSDVGSYAYAETGNANPHAATAIGTTSLAYDNNGNILSAGIQSYAWDYMNRMTGSNSGSGTSTYAYDYEGQRVLKTSGTTTEHYPNQYYNIDGTTKTKHIYAGGELVATIETTGATSTTRYIHGDHLGGTNVVTDHNAEVAELTDYYPFGSMRISEGEFDEQRKYIGQEYDEESDLSYLNARYYNGRRGQFISQDPVFWEIGQTDDSKAILQNPQLQNSYSYAINNPVTFSDPIGRCIEDLCIVEGLTIAAIRYGPQLMSYLSALSTPLGQITASQAADDAKKGNYFMAGLGIVTLGEGPAIVDDGYDALKSLNGRFQGTLGTIDAAAEGFNWGRSGTLVRHTVDHAGDFGLSSTDFVGYAKVVDDFMNDAQAGVKAGNQAFESFVGTGKNAGKTYYFDKNTSTFGVRNANGTNATAYKPKGGDPVRAQSYWNNKKANGGD